MLKVRAENIPQELLKKRQWVCWKGKPKKDGKLDKIPKNPRNGANASSTNSKTWTTFAEAWRAYEGGQYDGIGFVFSSGDPYCGIDLDNCRTIDTGEIASWALEIIREVKSYSEISPSGTGIKVIVKARLPGGGRKCKDIEMYDQSRFFTITGQHLGVTPIKLESRQDVITRLYEKHFPPEEPTSPPQPTTSCALADAEIIEKARNAKNGAKFEELWDGDISGHFSQSEADLALCRSLAFWVGNDPQRIDSLFRQSGLYREKWERKDYRERTIRKSIARTTNSYSPPEEAKGNTLNPDFPSWVMSGVAGDFAKLYASYLEVPAHFFYFGFLTCLGSVVADRLTLASEITPQPRLYVLLLGESADDRKSTALSKTTDFFREFFMQATGELHVCWGVGSAEGLQKSLKTNSRLLLCLDEFRHFVSKCKIEASVLLPCVNTLFETNRYESKTKRSDIYVENVYLSLLAASTIQTYENTWSAQFTDIGFNNRLFLVPGSGERKHSFPAKIPESDKYTLREQLGEVLRFVNSGLELDITDEAHKLYDKWYLCAERSIHAKRLDVYALRLMCLLTVNEHKGQVDEDIVRKVTALCDWQLAVRTLHDPIDAENKVARMEGKIRRILKVKGPQKDWEVKKAVNAHRDGLWVYDMAKRNLTRAKEMGIDRKGKGLFLKHE